MSYSELSLVPDEKMVSSESMSDFYIKGHAYLGLFIIIFAYIVFDLTLVSFLFFGLGSIIMIKSFVDKKTTEFVLTNKRLIVKLGLISRKVIEVKIDKIESIQIEQTVLGRIFNYGTLIVSGAGNPTLIMNYISNPLAFKSKIMNQK